MRILKSGHEIKSVSDWHRLAPPKKPDLHWKDQRSAKELARSWFRSDTPEPPIELRSVMERRFGPGVMFAEAEPECVVHLDDFRGEQRNCDLIVVCKAESQQIVISVEAKADEPFGERVGPYYDARKLIRQSNVPNRIEQLSVALFGKQPDAIVRNLRYQLLHSAAAALIEAQKRGGQIAVFIVHEFHSAGLDHKKVEQNTSDWRAFVTAFPELADAEVKKSQLLGPVSVPGSSYVPGSIPLYLGDVITELHANSGAIA